MGRNLDAVVAAYLECATWADAPEGKTRTYVEIDVRSMDTWPIRLDTDAGPVYLKLEEAETLIKQLEVATYMLDSIKRQSDTELKPAA